MKLIRKKYVEFFCPFHETSIRKIKTRKISTIPKNAFGFIFFDIISVSVNINGKKTVLASRRIDVSPMHYYGGKLYTVTKLKREFPNEQALIGNVKNRKCKAIKCRTGNWDLFKGTDILIKIP